MGMDERFKIRVQKGSPRDKFGSPKPQFAPSNF